MGRHDLPREGHHDGCAPCTPQQLRTLCSKWEVTMHAHAHLRVAVPCHIAYAALHAQRFARRSACASMQTNALTSAHEGTSRTVNAIHNLLPKLELALMLPPPAPFALCLVADKLLVPVRHGILHQQHVTARVSVVHHIGGEHRNHDAAFQSEVLTLPAATQCQCAGSPSLAQQQPLYVDPCCAGLGVQEAHNTHRRPLFRHFLVRCT